MVKVGASGTIVQDKQTTNGMLYKGTKVKVEDMACKCTAGDNNLKVSDPVGRFYWIGNSDILIA